MKKAIVFTLLVSAAVALQAQSNQASITGSVRDSTGAVIPDTQVTATNVATAIATQTRSDGGGNYHLVGLPPAVYRVSFTHPGFKSFEQDAVTLVVNQILELNATLSTGNVTEQVTVTTEPSALSTTTATLSDLVPARSVEGLPLNVRDPFALVGLTPGVQFGGNFGVGGAPDIGRGFYRDDFDIGGGRSASQEILLDGAPNTTGDGLNIINPPIDSVLEFKVTPNSYDAQYGRTSGGVVSFVTKSGTNQFHGVVYEFTRHSIFDANSYFNKANNVKLPSFARNQFGGDLGGPIYRKKVFFFVDYEGLRQGYPNTAISTVPTALQRKGDFSQTFASNGTKIAIYDPLSSPTQRTQFQYNGVANIIPPSRIDAVAAAVMALYPLPNVTGNAITNQNNYVYSAKAITNTDKYDIRGDYSLSEKTKLFGRFSRQQDTRLSTGTLPLPIGGGRQINDHFTQAVVDLNHVITPNVLADVSFSFGRALGVQLGLSNGFNISSLGWPSGLTPLLASQFPVFNIGDITGTSNGGDAIVNAQPRNVFSTLGVVYVQRGRHSLKFGGDIRNIHFNEGQNASPSGVFTFNRAYTQGPTPTTSSSTTGYGLASFLLGNASSGSVNQLQRISTQGLYYGVYVQDDWRVNDRLSLNLGLRWDVGIGDREKYNRLAYFDPNATSPLASAVGLPSLKGAVGWIGQGGPVDQQATDWTNAGPRFGLAYKADSKTVFRGGYSMFFYPRHIAGTNGGAIEAVRTTTMTTSLNNNITPFNTLSNPFPQGLLPAITDRNPLVNVGQTITAPEYDFRNGYSQVWSFGIQEELARGLVLDIHYWANKGTRILNTYNIDQLPDQYLALGSKLNTQVANPFYGNPAASGALAQPTISLQQSLLPFPQYTAVTQAYGPNSASTFNALTVQVDKRLSQTFTLLSNYTWSKALDDVRTPLDNYNRRAEKSFSPFDVRHQAHISFVYSLPYGRDRHFGQNQNRILTTIFGDWDVSTITNLQSGLPVSVSRPSVMAPGDAHLSHPTIAKWFNTSLFSAAPAYTFGNVGPYLSDVRTEAIHNLDAVLSKNFAFGPTDHPLTATFRAEAYNLTNTVQFGFPNNSVTSQSFGQVTSALNAPRDLQFAVKLRF